MDTGIKTSFIPKTTLARPSGTPVSGGMGFVAFFSILLLVVSLLGYLAAYSYNSLVRKEVASLEIDINKAKAAFDPVLLKVFENLDRRLRASNDLLTNHKTVEPLFLLFDQLTLKSVRFNNFNFTDSQVGTSVRLSGEALNFQAVALQALEFSKDNRIINPIFSNLGVDAKTGRVRFDVSFKVGASLISYASQSISTLDSLQ